MPSGEVNTGGKVANHSTLDLVMQGVEGQNPSARGLPQGVMLAFYEVTRRLASMGQRLLWQSDNQIRQVLPNSSNVAPSAQATAPIPRVSVRKAALLMKAISRASSKIQGKEQQELGAADRFVDKEGYGYRSFGNRRKSELSAKSMGHHKGVVSLYGNKTCYLSILRNAFRNDIDVLGSSSEEYRRDLPGRTQKRLTQNVLKTFLAGSDRSAEQVAAFEEGRVFLVDTEASAASVLDSAIGLGGVFEGLKSNDLEFIQVATGITMVIIRPNPAHHDQLVDALKTFANFQLGYKPALLAMDSFLRYSQANPGPPSIQGMPDSVLQQLSRVESMMDASIRPDSEVAGAVGPLGSTLLKFIELLRTELEKIDEVDSDALPVVENALQQIGRFAVFLTDSEGSHQKQIQAYQVIVEEVSLILNVLRPFSVEDLHVAQERVYADRLGSLSDTLTIKSLSFEPSGMAALNKAMVDARRDNPNSRVTNLDANHETYFELHEIQPELSPNQQSATAQPASLLYMTLNSSSPLSKQDRHERLNNLVSGLQKSLQIHPKATLVLDTTIEVDSQDLNALVSHLEPDIEAGRLEILLCKSHQKYSSLGSAKVYAGNITRISSKKQDGRKAGQQVQARSNPESDALFNQANGQFLTLCLKAHQSELAFLSVASKNAACISRFCWPGASIPGQRSSELGLLEEDPFVIRAFSSPVTPPTSLGYEKINTLWQRYQLDQAPIRCESVGLLKAFFNEHQIYQSSSFGFVQSSFVSVATGYGFYMRFNPGVEDEGLIIEKFWGLGQLLGHPRSEALLGNSLSDRFQNAQIRFKNLLGAVEVINRATGQGVDSERLGRALQELSVMGGEDEQAVVSFVKSNYAHIKASILRSVAATANLFEGHPGFKAESTSSSALDKLFLGEVADMQAKGLMSEASFGTGGVTPMTKRFLANQFLKKVFSNGDIANPSIGGLLKQVDLVDRLVLLEKFILSLPADANGYALIETLSRGANAQTLQEIGRTLKSNIRFTPNSSHILSEPRVALVDQLARQRLRSERTPTTVNEFRERLAARQKPISTRVKAPPPSQKQIQFLTQALLRRFSREDLKSGGVEDWVLSMSISLDSDWAKLLKESFAEPFEPNSQTPTSDAQDFTNEAILNAIKSL